MGNKQSNFSQWDPNRLSQATGIPPQQILALHQNFIQVAGNDNKMDKKEFRRCYDVLVPGGTHGHKAADRAFKAFDRDNTGYLTFEEFLSAYVMLNQHVTPYERASFLIDQYNPNSNGIITPEYGRQVFDRMNDFYEVPGDSLDAWSQFNEGRRDETIDRDQFAKYVANHPQYSSYF
ncbi:unnamed protein product [Didymodactylos carnosus]|uniref:EF-hand domain-containing protein n=1 Tax=Didymodactylos carnosus TaxID=1234261 RepID=A0A815CA11_9BILA|nr:unnamed protein product [Didymodactylos carnosus]CAF1348621.1 unnamed protein product [Didymodactylos carnosus]CAF4074694.1 unnamed protein product [Didymodactylos carnosus]CAF4159356.1 unnamed protein product [Didymodactylos carnosus]